MKRTTNTRYLVELALFIAIVLVMKLTGLSSIPVGPLNMTFTMVPIAIGAMLLGPLAGGVLGAVYGFTSLYDAMSGASVMTGFFFQISPFATFLLCVGTRILVGVATGWLFRLYNKADTRNIACYFLGGLTAPVLNTLFFMGFIVLVFYRTEFIQSRVAALGATGPLAFIVLSVGVQGLVEALTGLVIGGAVAKGVARALRRENSAVPVRREKAAVPVRADHTETQE